MPRMFSDGRLSAPAASLPPPSVRPEPEFAHQIGVDLGASAMARFSALAQRLDAVVEMLDQHAASSSFMEASSCASIMAGFGAQLP